jgi:hypothetical protein
MDDDDIERATLEMFKRFGNGTAHIARQLDEITDALPDIFRIALEMIERFGDDAVYIAREMAEVVDAIPDKLAVETWRDIADAIELLSRKP